MSYNQVVKMAAYDMKKYGYDSSDRVRRCEEAIIAAFFLLLLSGRSKKSRIRSVLRSEFERVINPESLKKSHLGLTNPYFSPALQTELERRILATSQLIDDSHKTMITLIRQRFEGWAVSIPVQNPLHPSPLDTKKIEKSLNLKPADARIIDDQKGKLKVNLNAIIARDNKAIAAVWHSLWRMPGYRYREEHKERDLITYSVRDNWAIQEGLMRKGGPYIDEITAPKQELNCKCSYTFLYRLDDLPEHLMTEKTKDLLDIKA